MRISLSKKKNSKKSVLALEVQILQTRNIDLLNRFRCHPVCFVSADSHHARRVYRPKNSVSRWNQTVKLNLPRSPRSDVLRVLLFDELSFLPDADDDLGSSCQSSFVNLEKAAGSLTPAGSPSGRATPNLRPRLRGSRSSSTPDLAVVSQLRSNSPLNGLEISDTASSRRVKKVKMRRRRQDSENLYIGEVRFSLLDMFRRRDSKTSYNFQLPPTWYTLYDRKRERKNQDISGNGKQKYPVGEIQLAFKLKCNVKHWSTIDGFNEWQNSLIDAMENKRLTSSSRSSSRLGPGMSKSLSLYGIQHTQHHNHGPSLPMLSPQSTASDIDALDTPHLVPSTSNSTPNIGKLATPRPRRWTYSFHTTGIDTLFDDYGLLPQKSNETTDSPPFPTSQNVDEDDLASIATALDEYEVLYPTESDSQLTKPCTIQTSASDPGNTLRDNQSSLDGYILTSPADVERMREANRDISDLEFVSSADSSNNMLSTSASFELGSGSDIESSSSSSTESDEEQSSTSSDSYSSGSSESSSESIESDARFEFRGRGLFSRSKRQSNKALNRLAEISETRFQVAKKHHSIGVLFVEFNSINNLPELRTKMSKRSFNMDPFIVATFGRRVFKTSSKKHTLNPTYDESIAFEVFPHEEEFVLYLNVFDKDAFSFNDEVAACNLQWYDILNAGKPDSKGWSTLHLPLKLSQKLRMDDEKSVTPILNMRVKFAPYSTLKEDFWKYVLLTNTTSDTYDIGELILFLGKLGSFTDDDAHRIFSKFKRKAWSGDVITREELVESLTSWKETSKFKPKWICPNCLKTHASSNNSHKSGLTVENDLFTHFPICVFADTHKVLKPSYVSSAFASKRWFSKLMINLTYGKYALGSNNANILVQDRDTGIVIEEKISAHVKLGIRILYNAKATDSKKFKHLLKKLSVRQGKKFDSPASIKQIPSFIRFHSLDMSECLETNFKTFNEFFYRKLKPGSRPPESPDPNILLSPADCRCTVFPTIQRSKEVWIKGSKFSIERLINHYPLESLNDKTSSIAIFRLAPQDYHRFHAPCNGIVGKPVTVPGEYYTVNPMAVRSELDVFGENTRMIVPIHSEEFGTFLLIPVGAMMVGSIILTCKEGDQIRRGEEMGYFKFGGSTVILVLPRENIAFDADLVKNSNEGIETLVRVGMSVGHTPESKPYNRKPLKVVTQDQLMRIKRIISVDDDKAVGYGGVPWEYRQLKDFVNDVYYDAKY